MALAKLLTSLFFSVVFSWDTGPSSCATKSCSGGTSATVALKYTDLAYDLWTPIHSMAKCPPSYTNTGFACVREGDEFDAPSHSAIPPAGYTNRLYHSGRGIDSYAKTCSTIQKPVSCKKDYVDMGCFCLRGAKVGKLSCRTGHYCDKNRGRCYRSCPKYYVNAGEKCIKSGSVLGKEAMKCPGGNIKYNTYCFPKKRTCPGGYSIWGSRCTRCYKQCPSGWFRSDVATCAYRLRWRGNTHLWIMYNALELLKDDPHGKRAYNYMMRPSCKKEWMKGIASMSEYSGAYSDDQHTHYYNPLKSDYYGKSTPYLTYPHRMASKPKNAKNVINTYLNKIGTEGCFALGKSLHFVIDTTMPAHTSGFGPTSKPTGLLAALEAYVPSIQNKYPISGVWDKRWKNKNPVDMVDEIAKTSNLKFAKTLFAQLLKKGATCHMKPEGCNQNYYGYCFVNQPHVKGTLGDALKDAYQSVASWIYSICTVRNYN